MTTDYNLHNEAQAALVVLRAMAMAEGNDGQPVDDETAEILISSETNLTEAIEAALLANAEDEAHVKAIKEVVADLKTRAERKAARIDRRKAAVLSALEIVGRKMLELATATVSASPGKPKVLIIRQDAIPDDYMRITTTREPDKLAIAEAFKARKPVDGCEMSNPMPYLRVTVR